MDDSLEYFLFDTHSPQVALRIIIPKIQSTNEKVGLLALTVSELHVHVVTVQPHTVCWHYWHTYTSDAPFIIILKVLYCAIVCVTVLSVKVKQEVCTCHGAKYANWLPPPNAWTQSSAILQFLLCVATMTHLPVVWCTCTTCTTCIWIVWGCVHLSSLLICAIRYIDMNTSSTMRSSIQQYYYYIHTICTCVGMYSIWIITHIHVVYSCMTLIGMHEMHGQVYPN